MDAPLDAANPRTGFAVVRIHPDEPSAVLDVERLQALNAEKGCTYFAVSTRMAPGVTLHRTDSEA